MGLAVGDHQDLPSASLFTGKKLPGQHQGVVQVGAGHPVVPGKAGQVLFLQLAGVVGEPDDVEGVSGVLLADQGEQRQGDLFGRRPVVEQPHGTALVQQYDGGGARHVFSAVDLKVVRTQLDRHLRPAADDGVFHRGLEVQLQRVAEFVGLGVAEKVAAGAAGVQVVVADAVPS